MCEPEKSDSFFATRNSKRTEKILAKQFIAIFVFFWREEGTLITGFFIIFF